MTDMDRFKFPKSGCRLDGSMGQVNPLHNLQDLQLEATGTRDLSRRPTLRIPKDGQHLRIQLNLATPLTIILVVLRVGASSILYRQLCYIIRHRSAGSTLQDR